MAYEDERAEELAEQGVDKRFAKQTIKRLKDAGYDDQTVDISAYYDRSLTYEENKKLFNRNFPASSDDRMAKEYGGARQADDMNARGYANRADQVKQAERDYFEERKNTPYTPKNKQIPGYKKFEKQPATMTERDKLISQTQPNQPNPIERAKGKLYELKSKYIDEPSQRARLEKKHKVRERTAQLSERVQLKREEEQLKRMEGELNTGRNQALSRFRNMGQTMFNRYSYGGTNHSDSVLKQSLREGSNRSFNMLGSNNMLNVTGPRSGAANLLLGGGMGGRQSHKGGHYRTIVEHGKASREWIPPEGQAQGNGSNSMLSMLSGTGMGNNTIRNNQPRDYGNRRKSGPPNYLGGSKNLGGNRKGGFPNFLGTRKRRWR